MLPAITVKKGDRVRAIGGIGGGYGDPKQRAPERVLDDVLDGYLTRAEAARMFSVAITADGRLDMSVTRRMRRNGR
jgi:N-methylhydantoinase B